MQRDDLPIKDTNHTKKQRSCIVGFRVVRVFKESGTLRLRLRTDQTPQLFSERLQISNEAKAAADEAMQRYADKDESELKTAVYDYSHALPASPRANRRANLYNALIDFLEAR